jgi:hypothetical protein
MPLRLEIFSPTGSHRFLLAGEDAAFRPLTAAEAEAETGWPVGAGEAGVGRRHPEEITLDLRLEAQLTS